MKDITAAIEAGKAVFESAQTATCFPGRKRAFKTGVKADPALVKAIPILVSALEQMVELDLVSDASTDEILVTVHNLNKEPFLIEEGMTICSEAPVRRTPAAKPKVSEPDLNDIIKSAWDHSDPGPIEVLVDKDSEIGKALTEALESEGPEDDDE